MTIVSRILKVGSMVESMSVYLPAIAVQLLLGLGRVVFFTYWVDRAQMGVWGTAVKIVIIGSPLVTLGASHGLTRYVSLFEARGELLTFYRRARVYILILLAVLMGLMVLISPWLMRWVLFPQAVAESGGSQNWQVCLAVLANVALMALYLNMVSFMYGLRVYGLASVSELFFSVMFTVTAVAAVVFRPTAFAMLVAHGMSLAGALVLGSWLLGVAVRRISQTPASVVTDKSPSIEPETELDGATLSAIKIPSDAPGMDLQTDTRPAGIRTVVKFGLAGMVGTFVWQIAENVSYYMTYLLRGDISAGGFHVMMKFAQPLLCLANACWGVLFAHVARRWESNDRVGALATMETAYKAIVLVAMTLSVLLYCTWPIWIRILYWRYQYGHEYLSGLLTYYMMVSNMSMLVIPAKLNERPLVIVLAALTGAALNVLLAGLWMPHWGEVGAARAAGVGMFFGGGLVMMVYLQTSKTMMGDSTYFLLGTPVLLLLPPNIIGPLWAVILPVCFFSGWIFTDHEKTMLKNAMIKGWWHFWRIFK